jgi:hypothetical protein
MFAHFDQLRHRLRLQGAQARQQGVVFRGLPTQ